MSIRNSKMGIVLARDTGARGGRERGDGRGGGAGVGGGADRRYAGRESAAPGRKTPSGSFLRLRGVSPPIVERKLPDPVLPVVPLPPPPPPPACLPAGAGARPSVCRSVPPASGVPSPLPAPVCVPAGDGPGSPPHPRCREWGPGSWRRGEWAEGRLALGLLGEVSGTPSAPRRCHHFLSPSRY